MSRLKTFQLLQKLLPLVPPLPDSMKSKSEGYMDLNFDLLSQTDTLITFALSHYYKHPSGDMIADPDMVIRVDIKVMKVEPLSYQDTFGYQSVYTDNVKDAELEKKLLAFLNQWLTNLINQDNRFLIPTKN